MAINVNTVYTTVLTILNKEQRGYLTPEEFNKVAAQVQLEIFEDFFEQYNQYIRMPKTDVEFASRMDKMKDEFQIFEKNASASAVAGNVYNLPTDLHRFGSAFYEKAIGSPEIEIVSKREYHQQILSPLLQPSINNPIAIYQQNKLTVYPAVSIPSAGDIGFNYIRKPLDPIWGYGVGNLGQYVWDGTPGFALTPVIPTTGSVNFEISEMQQTEIILKILQYAGVIIRDQSVIQAATSQLNQDTQNEKS
tara:strand:- start:134 stop:880 length:747 start_codon:yes stop_codon:yes gene_type:complete